MNEFSEYTNPEEEDYDLKMSLNSNEEESNNSIDEEVDFPDEIEEDVDTEYNDFDHDMGLDDNIEEDVDIEYNDFDHDMGLSDDNIEEDIDTEYEDFNRDMGLVDDYTTPMAIKNKNSTSGNDSRTSEMEILQQANNGLNEMMKDYERGHQESSISNDRNMSY